MLPTNDVSAQITFMELSLGGFGWIPSLAAADSSFILPVTLGLTNLAIIEVNNRLYIYLTSSCFIVIFIPLRFV